MRRGLEAFNQACLTPIATFLTRLDKAAFTGKRACDKQGLPTCVRDAVAACAQGIDHDFQTLSFLARHDSP